MHEENQHQKKSVQESRAHEGNDKDKQASASFGKREESPRGRGLSDELVGGETLDVGVDPAKPA
jgi:hypothetical protein